MSPACLFFWWKKNVLVLDHKLLPVPEWPGSSQHPLWSGLATSYSETKFLWFCTYILCGSGKCISNHSWSAGDFQEINWALDPEGVECGRMWFLLFCVLKNFQETWTQSPRISLVFPPLPQIVSVVLSAVRCIWGIGSGGNSYLDSCCKNITAECFLWFLG